MKKMIIHIGSEKIDGYYSVFEENAADYSMRTFSNGLKDFHAAKLFQAAPELLECLKEAVEDSGDGGPTKWCEAIKKAEGK